VLYIVFIVRGDSFKAANCYRLFVDTSAAACRLAWAVASAPENARKDIRIPIDHVCLGIFSLGDQPDVLGHGCVRRTGVLTVYDLVEILRIFDVCRFQIRSVLEKSGFLEIFSPKRNDNV
jgi:hypothetical protein